MAGGESGVFENLYRLLQAVGQDVTVYSRHSSELLNLGIDRKITMGIEAFHSSQTWNEIRSLVDKERPQIAIVQNVFPIISPSVYYALKSAGIPIIQAVYNYRFVCPNAHLYTQGAICDRCVEGNHIHAILGKCYKNSLFLSGWYAAILGLHRIIGTFARNIDIFMVPDQFMSVYLSKGGIPIEKIRKNVDPFFVEDYQPCYQQGSYILYAGRLVKQKGVFTLVKAMSKVSSDSLPLYIVGEGEAQGDIKLLIEEMGLQHRVRLLGPKWVDEMKQLIEDCSFVVIPSEWYDNLPLILCQAYATAKPWVASAINGIPEYVENEKDVLLFPPGSVQDLARCIDRLCTDSSLIARMAVNARRKAEELFDFRAYWHTLSSIIQELTT